MHAHLAVYVCEIYVLVLLGFDPLKSYIVYQYPHNIIIIIFPCPSPYRCVRAMRSGRATRTHQFVSVWSAHMVAVFAISPSRAPISVCVCVHNVLIYLIKALVRHAYRHTFDVRIRVRVHHHKYRVQCAPEPAERLANRIHIYMHVCERTEADMRVRPLTD